MKINPVSFLLQGINSVCIRDLYSLPEHRSGGVKRVDGDGYDDVVADDYFTTVQINAVCSGRRLAFNYRFADPKLLYLKGNSL